MPVRAESPGSFLASGANSGYTALSACTLLSAGQSFFGNQNVSSHQKDEAWRVNVCMHGCDLEHGYLCGTMEALNVPMTDTPVVTFWEGEIVDAKNYNFFGGKWQATGRHKALEQASLVYSSLVMDLSSLNQPTNEGRSSLSFSSSEQ